ncbi:MAG: hypothetical protein HY689_15920 [Chloroflexi bacterium]|nr:hypothetical protein [Chloroflexota bacterium]
MARISSPVRRTPLALVHHGNQNLITDGYDNREGISTVVERFAAVLDLHRRYRIPLHLHLSGTLLEAIAWHRPDFFAVVRGAWEAGLLEIVGSCYSQNIMPLFSPEHNLRQLNEELDAIARFLGVPARRVRIAWVPERVWNTEALAPVLRHRALRNGGYHAVLLDDRLVYLAGPASAESPRAAFDRQQVRWIRDDRYGHGAPERLSQAPSTRDLGPSSRCHEIAGSGGLVLLPISFALRHLIPPWSEDAFDQVRTVLAAVRECGPDAVAVYGDDLEKVAGIGPWAPAGLDSYETFLAWLREQPDVTPVLLSHYLRGRRPARTVPVEPGTFFELAHLWEAGEEYHGWWRNPAWEPYARSLAQAEDAVTAARAAGGNPALLDLADKHLMVCAYETGWHVPGEGVMEPAPWSRATASHARASLVIAAAARWMAQRDGRAHARLHDIDGDGEDELLLSNDHLLAVCSPAWGGRLVYLFDLRGRAGKLMVGNPSDDWNWQEELNRAMDCPPNHPGALAEVGGEHDPYSVEIVRTDGARAAVVLHQSAPGSPLAGMRKVLELNARSRALEVTYLPPPGAAAETVCCLSPDYLGLLRTGRSRLAPLAGPGWRGWRNGPAVAWVAVDGAGGPTWQDGTPAGAGHGCLVRFTWAGPTRIRIGVGPPPTAARPARARKAA